MGLRAERVVEGFAGALLALCLSLPSATLAQDWTIGISTIGEMKYQPGFKKFDYVNADAPKGGDIDVSELGTFDNLNPAINKGNLVAGLGMVFEPLLKPSLDEVFSSYGLIAESMSYPDDFSAVSFRLNPKAEWADGKPITVDDVIFSFEKSKEYDQSKMFYYAHVKDAKASGPNEVTFTFDLKDNRELPNIMGQLLVLPKHWWEATGANGKPRDISATTLEVPMGSGPYKIVSVKPGSSIQYALRDDYWGKDLNVNIGYNNFRTIRHTYFSDRNVEFEAFKSGDTDYWEENAAKRWAQEYDFPAVKDGRIKREEPDNEYKDQGVLVGFLPNIRREKFKDQRVREALNYAFDFEELNRLIFFKQYSRINSYFYGSELASSGLPQGKELEILNEVKDLVPPEVFTEEYVNPVGGTPQNTRANLQKAIGLLKQAGYEIRGSKMVNAKTGQPFAFEIMLNSPIIEPVALAYAANLKKIGIAVNVRSVDASQFAERSRNRDYDILYSGWAESLNPGNEQAEYWGSKSAATPGTKNFIGIADPGIDRLIERVIFSKDRDAHVAAVKALDRVLLHHHYVVPSYTIRHSRIAYWDIFEKPKELPKYSIGFPSIWWTKK